MGLLGEFFQILLTPLTMAANFIADTLAAAHGRTATIEDFSLAALIVTGIAMGALGSYWVAWMYARMANANAAHQAEMRRTEAALRFHDMLLQQSCQSIAILEPNQDAPFFFGQANRLLQKSMAGEDAAGVAKALDALIKSGIAFESNARIATDKAVRIRGLPVGRCAVLFLDEIEGDPRCDFGEALDNLPAPVWLRAGDKSLCWGNRAFLTLLGANTIDAPQTASSVFVQHERELALSVLENGKPVETQRYVTLGGRRKAIAFKLMPLPGGGVIGSAVDTTESRKENARLELELKAGADLLDHLSVAVAVFGESMRLAQCNAAYARLWGLSRDWLAARPSFGEILDRARELRKLPEQRDFAGWKRRQLQRFESEQRSSEEVWHLPEGKSIEVKMRPHLEGGLVMIFEDVSERFRLKSDSAMFAQVQQATLEAVCEGMAIFAADGRLIAHNSRFADMWSMTEKDLLDHPHFQDIARLSCVRPGSDEIWSIVAAGISAVEPEHYGEWARVKQESGHSIVLSMSRLPNGDTVVIFTDFSEEDALDSALRGKGSGHAAI